MSNNNNKKSQNLISISFLHSCTQRILGLWLNPEFSSKYNHLYLYTVSQNKKLLFSLCNKLQDSPPRSSISLSELGLLIAHWAAGSFTAGGRGSCVFGLKGQWGGIDAVAFPCGSWTVIKQVSQMSSTLSACRLHSVHSIGEIIGLSDGVLLQEVKEGRPTWSGVKFRAGAEQGGPTDNTSVGPFICMIRELSTEGTLGAPFLGHMVLLRCEAFPQLLLSEAQRPCLFSPTCSWGKTAGPQRYRLTLGY